MAMTYRWMVDELHLRLAGRGWEGVRPAFGFVLLALRPAPLTTTALAAELEVTKQAASKLVDAMDAAGLVSRTPDPDDGRRIHLSLTPQGRELLADVEDIHRALEAECAEAVGAVTIEGLREGMTRLILAFHDGVLPTIRPTA
ncbi:MAG: MarR family transcriptional regulator [Thermoleophilia bacterium]